MLFLLVSGCSENIDYLDSKSSNYSENTNYQQIEWEELEPEGQVPIEYTAPTLESLGIPEDYPDNFDEEYSENNNGEYTDEYSDLPSLRELTSGYGDDFDGPPPQALSIGVVSEMDGKHIRLAGYIVPLEFNSNNLVTEFFLVPYFGACFHQPAPPPNQTVYVTAEKPIRFESIYDPVWVNGLMTIEQTGNELATAAYKMELNLLEAYTEYH